MAHKENKVVQDCMLAAAECGAVVFRNNVGLAEANGYKIRYGLCNGSADLIGWTKDGKFLAIECKAPNGKPTKEQVAFLKAIGATGGIGILAYSADDVYSVLK